LRCRAFLLALLVSASAQADDAAAIAAVSSNFVHTFTELADRFRQQTGYAIAGSSGSTGKLYAQVVNGGPFSIYLAADAERPRHLEERGYAVAGSRFTYARGRLVVWSETTDDCRAALLDPSAGRIAIANPETAPYGRAAREYLSGLGAWEESRIVTGSNVRQAQFFAQTGNATVAVIAASLARIPTAPVPTCMLDVPQDSHAVIEQQAVLLRSDNVAARRFLDYLRSDEARAIIAASGYEVPE